MKDLMANWPDEKKKKFFDNNFLNATYRQYQFFRKHKRFLNLRNLKTYDDKLNWLIINRYDASYGKYADKYEVRKIIQQNGLDDLVVNLYGVYDRVEDIDFGNLPEKYVLMLNHGSGPSFYFINRGRYTEKELASAIEKAKTYLADSMKVNFYLGGGERQYEDIVPRILCLEYLENNGKVFLTDYKVLCSYGKCISILVVNERYGGLDYYSTEWEYLPYVKESYRSGVIEPKPVLLDEMLQAASKLSKNLPLARVDFYIVDNKLYFGEITLTPCAGVHKNLNWLGQIEMGKQIELTK